MQCGMSASLPATAAPLMSGWHLPDNSGLSCHTHFSSSSVLEKLADVHIWLMESEWLRLAGGVCQCCSSWFTYRGSPGGWLASRCSPSLLVGGLSLFHWGNFPGWVMASWASCCGYLLLVLCWQAKARNESVAQCWRDFTRKCLFVLVCFCCHRRLVGIVVFKAICNDKTANMNFSEMEQKALKVEVVLPSDARRVFFKTNLEALIARSLAL